MCRKKGCKHVQEAPDMELRHCPTHGAKLWPKAKVRKIRFHDLRHTTASLLMMGGANPAAVQRIMRHSDPRITTEVYGHLLPGYLRDEIPDLVRRRPRLPHRLPVQPVTGECSRCQRACYIFATAGLWGRSRCCPGSG